MDAAKQPDRHQATGGPARRSRLTERDETTCDLAPVLVKPLTRSNR